MANDYAQKRIQAALKDAKGNETRARNLLIEWALKDQMLLLALTQNHIKSIASHAIAQATSNTKDAQKETAQKINKKPATIDVPVESFGKDLLKALSGRDSVKFGMESATGRPINTKKKKASQQHIDTLKKLSTNTPKDQKSGS